MTWAASSCTRRTGCWPGAVAVGPDAATWMAEVTLAIRAKIPVTILADVVHAFPTYGEALQTAFRELAGTGAEHNQGKGIGPLSELDMETPEDDAYEQHQEVVADENGTVARREVPFDVDEADAAEQERAVGFDDDDYRLGWVNRDRPIATVWRPEPVTPLTATPDTRPRSNRLPRHERRRQLLEAALEVFVSQGYHAAAMDEIAERAGVSKPVLYQHFPGKLDLYLALLDQSVDELVATVRDALRSTPDNKQRVAATFSAYFGYVESEGQAFRLVFESDLANEAAVRDRLARSQRECAELISQVVKNDAGLDDAEAHLLSVAMVGLAQVTARYWLSTRDHMPREAAEQLVARLAWRGISGWPRS